MDEKIQRIERDIAVIKERNLRVEDDKAWETSSFRIFSITVITYIITSLVLYFSGSEFFLLNALVPTVGFFLSIQTLPAVKNGGLKSFYVISNKLQKNVFLL